MLVTVIPRTRTLLLLAMTLASPALGESSAVFSLTGLSDVSPISGDWNFDEGELRVTHSLGAKAVLKDVSLADFDLEVEVKLAKATTQAGVIFRASEFGEGAAGFRGYYAGIEAGESQALWGASDAEWSLIASQPMAVETDTWHLLRLQVRGSQVTVFANAVPVAVGRFPKFDGTDTRFSKGSMALRALGGDAAFRGLRVRPAATGATGAHYTNPLQNGCADPCVLKHGGRYYAYTTHTLDFPQMVQGVRAHSSTDLVHWKDEGFILKNEDSWGESRFWAPDILEKDGLFYLYYAADTRICVATAKSPLGPFKQDKQEPIAPESIRIDGHVFQDDDGQRYFYYVKFNAGNEIWGSRLNTDLRSVDESSLKMMVKPDQRWEQHKGCVTEGPVMLKHKGTYYLTYSGSHFESPEYAVGYATSESPLGPWTKYAHNPVMKSTAYAHGTAHHCFTTSPDGSETFIVYHRHHDLTKTEPRQLSIDRLQFVPQAAGPDVIEVWGPTSTPQPMPK
jgi:GH43 family beta-xylosidase